MKMEKRWSEEFQKAGPEPAILDWYGHCVRLSVNKLGGSGGMLPQGKFFKLRHSEIASEAIFGQKYYYNLPTCNFCS